MSISDRPIGAFALVAVLATVAIWGERKLARLGVLHQFDLAAAVLFFAGWLGLGVLIVTAYRRMRADARRRGTAEQVAGQASRLMQLTAALGGARTSIRAIESILQEPVHALRADAAMVLLLAHDRESATVARGIGYPNLPDRLALR